MAKHKQKLNFNWLFACWNSGLVVHKSQNSFRCFFRTLRINRNFCFTFFCHQPEDLLATTKHFSFFFWLILFYFILCYEIIMKQNKTRSQTHTNTRTVQIRCAFARNVWNQHASVLPKHRESSNCFRIFLSCFFFFSFFFLSLTNINKRIVVKRLSYRNEQTKNKSHNYFHPLLSRYRNTKRKTNKIWNKIKIKWIFIKN